LENRKERLKVHLVMRTPLIFLSYPEGCLETFQNGERLAQEIGAKGLLGQVKLELGLLHKIKGRTDEARKCISDAVRLFEECEADVFLKQAREELASLK
jgi:hypothetical protein